MIPNIILIFFAGVIIDMLSVRYTGTVEEKRLWSATLLSGLITITNFALLVFIIKGNAQDGFLNILAYAGGNSLGTYVAMRKA
jgi:hypothetical protein